MFLSIMGMYEFDDSLFDGLDVPTYTDPVTQEIHVIDKTTVINNILLECAELEIMYPNFDTMKLAIGVWSASEYRIWEKLLATQFVTYNPIWNVDANVSHTERKAGSDNRTSQKYNTVTPNTTDEHSVQGYNTTTWAASDKDTHTGTITDNGTITDTNTDDHTTTYNETRTGNIGVTATQDLIKKEREIAEFSIINYITQSFKRRFCLLVY